MITYNKKFEIITNDQELNSIVIPYNIDIRNINISLENPLNFLTIKEKLQLYQYLIEQEKFYKTSNSASNSKMVISLLKKEKAENKEFNITSYFNNGQQTYQNDLVFIGRKDYNKYVRGTNLESRVIKNSEIPKNYLDLSKIDKDNIFTYKELKKLNNVVFRQNQSEDLDKKEIFIVQEQLANCYKDAIIKNKSKLVVPVSIEFNLNKDGYINTKKIKMTIIDKKNEYSSSDYSASINIVKTTLVLCNPLKNLPPLKYRSWKSANFMFNKID